MFGLSIQVRDSNIKKWWEEANDSNWAGFSFMEKSKTMKEKLKVWNREVFGNISSGKVSLTARIDCLDTMEEASLNDDQWREKVMLKASHADLILKEQQAVAAQIEN